MTDTSTPPLNDETQDWNSPQEGDNGNEQSQPRSVGIGTAPAYQSDNRFYRIVVHFLGWTMLVCTVGAIALSLMDKEIPDIIVAIGSASIGALAGLFAPSHR